MGTDIPKQFLLLNGKPVLMHTLDKFKGVCDELILVLPEAQVAYWKELCAEHQFTTIHNIVNGGSERFYSVLNGLSSINSDEGLVAIHDGVRPCVSVQLIQRTFEEAALLGAAIAAVKSKDSLRKVTSTGTEAVDRSHYYLVQTPQTFSLAKLK